MLKKLLPVVLALVGIGAGVGAGIAFKPAHEEVLADGDPCGPPAEAAHEEPAPPPPDEDLNYVKMSNQFVVPVVDKGKVSSLVVLSLSLEVPAGRQEFVYAREPKLRDGFLQVLFDHANIGGFEGSFTESGNLDVLRQSLRETARDLAGSDVLDVLIMDIVRQDV